MATPPSPLQTLTRRVVIHSPDFAELTARLLLAGATPTERIRFLRDFCAFCRQHGKLTCTFTFIAWLLCELLAKADADPQVRTVAALQRHKIEEFLEAPPPPPRPLADSN